MFDPFTLALIGAGVGGGLSLLRGEDLGGSLKNAAIGGGLGYAGGQFLPSAFGATPATATSAAIPKEALAGAFGQEALPASMLMTDPTAGMAANGAGVNIFGGIAPSGAGGAIPMQAFQQAATGTGTNIVNPTPSFFSGMSDYMTPQNVLGAASALNQPSATPPIMSGGGGGVRGGQAPSAEEIKNLLNTIRVQELVNRRRFA